ncbi:MAG TPA: PIN domain-containing protein [Nostocaceae cyanobacterium]|nr:PIN domain-containing protein [Nostocaceae cyanobacterium]
MKICLDSNIWIYALNQSQDIRKHQISNALATQIGLYLSTQIINEVCVNLIKKANFTENQIQNLIQGFYQIHHIIEIDINILLKASMLRSQYLFSFWDSLIVASVKMGRKQ